MSIKCPLCNSTNTKIKYEITLNHVVSRIDNRSDEIRKEIKKIWRGTTCKFMRCGNCTFSFAHPFRGGTNKLYSLIYQNNYPTERWEYGLALTNISKKDVCLEIGAGNGGFLNKLLNKCKKDNVYSVEASNDNGDYKNLDDVSDRKKFSVFCMFQVLEHLADFQNAIKKINIMATKDAKMFISVPHEDGVDFFRKKLGYGDLPPAHVSSWNKKTIGMLKGWEIVDYKVKTISPVTIFKDLFYGYRVIKYPRTHNPFLLLNCAFNALIKTGFKDVKTDQFFYLEREII